MQCKSNSRDRRATNWWKAKNIQCAKINPTTPGLDKTELTWQVKGFITGEVKGHRTMLERCKRWRSQERRGGGAPPPENMQNHERKEPTKTMKTKQMVRLWENISQLHNMLYSSQKSHNHVDYRNWKSNTTKFHCINTNLTRKINKGARCGDRRKISLTKE